MRAKVNIEDTARVNPRSPIARGCAFHPRAIDDPRGRNAVRASAAVIVRYDVLRRTIAALRPLRAARANRVFRTDKKHIRTEKTVMVNPKETAGVLFKIADCTRPVFSFAPQRSPATTWR
jgi:hypothetical protein